MKDKIEEKQHEIIDLKKQLQLKANELQDALWKEQNLEKRLEKLQKAVVDCMFLSDLPVGGKAKCQDS